jgi:lipid-binding SYLF domain-containing protein
MAGYIRFALLSTILMAGMLFVGPNPARAASASEINRGVDAALRELFAKTPSAKELSEKAKAILVFPAITKAGFFVGGQYGEGALRERGRTVGYYDTVAASYGLQFGAQQFGYALFFMNESSLGWLDKSDGWELGTGPSIVIVNTGAATTMTTTTAQSDVYAFFFNQRGLMAGFGLQGSKISKIQK